MLDRVKQTAPGRWVACCPSHDDRHPSLAIRELDDGRVLLHCFGGCDTASILAAVGLSFEDLFSEPLPNLKAERRPFNAIDILRCVEFEALVVAVAASNLAKGVPMSGEDQKRLLIAATRLQRAAEVANV